MVVLLSDLRVATSTPLRIDPFRSRGFQLSAVLTNLVSAGGATSVAAFGFVADPLLLASTADANVDLAKLRQHSPGPGLLREDETFLDTVRVGAADLA